jgi:hypothetical protein
MRSVEQLSDLDTFFFYGLIGLDYETECDIFAGVMQPERSMYYNRNEGCGVETAENYPNTAIAQIGFKYSIMNFIAWRNSVVADGSGGHPDRRVAASQSSIDVSADYDGNVDITVLYIPYSDYKQFVNLNIPLTGGGNV